MAYTVDLTQGDTHRPTISREILFYKRYNMYHDNYRSQVYDRMVDIYTKAAEIRLDKQADFTDNVYKTIVNKISRVYSFGVERAFIDTKMEELYNDNSITKIMKQANRYTNAFNDMLLQISWNEDKPRFIFRYPHKTRVTLNEWGEPSEVEYFVDSDEAEPISVLFE